MTSHTARDMHGVVQKTERHRHSVPCDMTRSPHERRGCVNLIAPYGNFRSISLTARTVPRDDMDRIDAIMLSSRLSLSDLQEAACRSKRRRGENGIFHRLHLIPRWATAVLTLGLSLSSSLFGRHVGAIGNVQGARQSLGNAPRRARSRLTSSAYAHEVGISAREVSRTAAPSTRNALAQP